MLQSRGVASKPAAVLRRQAANILTGGRLVLLFAAAGLAVSQVSLLKWLAVPVALTALLTDWLDGIAARRWGTPSKIGGIMDIAGDRIVENVWWITFAWLRLIPLWIPIVVITRGVLTDAIRSFALSRGLTAFGNDSMMQSRLGYAVVASRGSRGTYCASKVLTFTALFALNAAESAASVGENLLSSTAALTLAATYATVILCIVRGVPVLIESRKLFRSGTVGEPSGVHR